jgi:hypothetical protein
VKAEVLGWQRGEVAEVLDDWDTGAQQKGVDRTLRIRRVVDVERVDSNDRRLGLDEQLRRVSR